MIVNEIFYSLQGEGRLTGVPSVFIRISGCPLRCGWCDTKYAWDDEAGTDMAVDQVIEKMAEFPSNFVVITGGEPMANGHLPMLVSGLSHAGKHLTVETAGINYLPDLPVDLMSISPKLSNSVPEDPGLARVHEKSRLNLKALRLLVKHYDYQLKFVIQDDEDYKEAQDMVEQIGGVNPAKVMLMPQARDQDELLARAPKIAEMCTKSGYTFCQRLHILLWGNVRGK